MKPITAGAAVAAGAAAGVAARRFAEARATRWPRGARWPITPPRAPGGDPRQALESALRQAKQLVETSAALKAVTPPANSKTVLPPGGVHGR
jgi:hypothetical protein